MDFKITFPDAVAIPEAVELILTYFNVSYEENPGIDWTLVTRGNDLVMEGVLLENADPVEVLGFILSTVGEMASLDVFPAIHIETFGAFKSFKDGQMRGNNGALLSDGTRAYLPLKPAEEPEREVHDDTDVVIKVDFVNKKRL